FRLTAAQPPPVAVADPAPLKLRETVAPETGPDKLVTVACTVAEPPTPRLPVAAIGFVSQEIPEDGIAIAGSGGFHSRRVIKPMPTESATIERRLSILVGPVPAIRQRAIIRLPVPVSKGQSRSGLQQLPMSLASPEIRLRRSRPVSGYLELLATVRGS